MLCVVSGLSLNLISKVDKLAASGFFFARVSALIRSERKLMLEHFHAALWKLYFLVTRLISMSNNKYIYGIDKLANS